MIKTKEALSDVISFFTLNNTINKTKAVLYAHLCVYSHSGCAILTELRLCCQISISYANLTTNISIETKLRIICVICVFILKYTRYNENKKCILCGIMWLFYNQIAPL